ncbi:MAG TPA: prephenate dehydrogenase [Rhabdochlamydiaceae bacterium]|nr:prephenate dehydrogenase [Candidatus Woesearchaeota archaeon]HKZ00562.1 prephenate dehydrogenase [Rhabdochlamydiaceae bacterium]
MEVQEIGVIGTGDMGKLHATEFAKLGYRVNVCDLPEKRGELEANLGDVKGIKILDDGVAVSRRSDLTFYLVEMENTGEALAKYGHSTKKGYVVSLGTSVMTPFVEAAEKYLPKDAHVINWHWLFGHSVIPQGKSSALVNYRSSPEAFQASMGAFGKVGIKIEEILHQDGLLAYQVHDKIMADTQAVTHMGFESMGTAWKNAGFYPWENPQYAGGIDNIKALMTLRVLGGKSHVYGGLAILNPFAQEQISQYARSVSELYAMMVQGDKDGFRKRIAEAAEFVFGNGGKTGLLLDDRIMGEYSLGAIPEEDRKDNTHLSQLAAPDAWRNLRIIPYKNFICKTPPFMLRVGIVEYLFRNPELLEKSIDTALNNKEMIEGDLPFVNAVKEWASIIGRGDMASYKREFENTKSFFPPEKLKAAKKKSDELIERLAA